MRSTCQTFFLIALCALLSACPLAKPFEQRGSVQAPDQSNSGQSNSSGQGVQTQGAATSESNAAAQPLPEPVIKQRTLSPAAKALLAQSQTQMSAGNNALAAATIERALRIEQDSPLLWIELAKIRQNEGSAAQAENLARKALTMATGDGKTQAAAWRVIADSYRARNRNPEARDADAKAQALGG